MLAESGTIDLARLLLDLLIVLAAAKIAAEVAERCRVPAVLGEIVAGIVIGPSGFGLIKLGGDRGVSMAVLAEIGVLLLLLSVGMEMDLGELGKVGGTSMAVATIGVVVPFAAGTIVGLAFGESTNTAIFFGAALTATSVGITARVFGDLRALASLEARIVLGAAVADDVLGLIILTVVVKVVTGGSVGPGTVLSTVGLAVAFLAGTGALGVLLVPRIFGTIHKRATSAATLVVAAFALMLAFAALADLAKLAFIIGAFMAGLALGRTQQHERIASDLGAVANVFIPVFFLSIGINADLAAMAKPAVLGLAAAMTVVAILGKLAAAVGSFGRRTDRLLIGIGMIPRGEVGLIFASIGLANGVLNGDQYGALLIVILVTTVITPPLLRLRLASGPVVSSSVQGEHDDEPAEGWVRASDGEVRLQASPPPSAVLSIALGTAALADQGRPSDELLDWFGATRREPVEWDTAHTPALVDLLHSDEPRAWRFLDVTGVLERALPEIATAMVRRRADMSDLDPLGSLRFPVVDRLHQLSNDDSRPGAETFGEPTDDLALAALVADVCLDGDEMTSLASRLTRTVDADRIMAIVNDAQLLRARSHDHGGFDEHEVLQLATHLASRAHAQDAYVLAIAMGELSATNRHRLDHQYEQVLNVLEHPEVSGGEATNLAASRRVAAERLLDEDAAIERLRFAPITYLLAHDPEELARQARLVEPLPRAGAVRVAVSPEPEPDHWKVDVACRDTDGLLARLADVLTMYRLNIVAADIATWPDEAVLCSFIVRAPARPAARALGEAFESRLLAGLKPTARPFLELSFDNDALPWLTVCTVRGPDEPGVLQSVSTAFASAGAVIHSARIGSNYGSVNDRFAVSDRFNRKLDEATIARVRTVLATGKRPGRRG
jgi:Kef-type K+ transport system membrane component KefB